MDVAEPRALRLPPDSRIPDPSPGSALPRDYDHYFSIDRQPTDLSEWTASCLSLEKDLLSDLHATDLSERDQNQILVGLVIIYRATLERWKRAAHRPEPTASSGHAIDS